MKKTFQFIFFLGLAVLLLWLISKDLTQEQVDNILLSIQQANYYWIALALAAAIFSHISRAYRWRMLLEPLGTKVRILTAFYAVMIGYLANIAFPRLGEFSKCGIVSRYEGVKFEKVVGTMVAERVFDLIALFLLLVITVAVQFDFLYSYFSENVLQPIFGKLGSIALPIIGVSGLLILFLFRNRLRRLLIEQPKIKGFLSNLKEGVLSVRKLKQPIAFAIHTIIIWSMYFIMIWIVFFAFPETEHLSILAGITLLVLGSFGVIATPGGIGAYQLIVSQALIGLYALEQDISLAFAWVVWSAQTILIIVVGFLSFIGLGVTKKVEIDVVN